jgi:ABC-2 type transport system permease protein
VRNTAAIFKKELKSFFNSPIAYIYTTVFLAFMGWFFFRSFFVIGQAEMRLFFNILPWVFLFLIPAITMRLWSEERKLGTLEIIMTLPVRDIEVVAGKFLASAAFLVFTIVLTFPIAVTVFLLGDPDPGPILGAYIGAVLMGGAYLAVGLFASSLTENQIIAFIVGVVLTFFLFIIGEDFILVSSPEFLAPVLSYLGLGTHYRSLMRGVVDSRDLVYYFSVIFFFLYANVKILETRKI